MKLSKKKVSYIGKDNKTHTTYNFVLIFDNGFRIPIKPSFKENYVHLSILAETINESGK